MDKVLFLMEDLCFGGTQKQMLALASRLDRKLFSPVMLTLTGPTDLDEAARQADIALFHMGSSRKACPFFFARLGQCLKAIAPDILIPCTALPNIWGRLWGRALRVPLIAGTCRGGGAPVRQHERFLWRLAHHLICNSRHLLTAMGKRGVPPGRMTYIPNGVDTDFFRPAPPRNGEEKIILCAARLARDKDHLTLIRAFAAIAPKFPSASLRLVGEGPEEQKLRAFTSGKLPAEISSRIHFAGADVDMRPHYAAADIFALSSQKEAQPNVILEAMSSGLPVCATRAGGIPDLVEQDKTGLLSAPGNVEMLANNLAILLNGPEHARSLGQNGRRVAEENFSLESMTQAHQELLLSLRRNRTSTKGRENA